MDESDSSDKILCLCLAIFREGEFNMTRSRLFVVAFVLFSTTLLAERTRLKPATGIFSQMFSVEQDIELGREAAKDAEKQLVLVNNRDANAYVAALGQQLVAKAPNENKFPFTFKIVDDRSINAFALPGGPI